MFVLGRVSSTFWTSAGGYYGMTYGQLRDPVLFTRPFHLSRSIHLKISWNNPLFPGDLQELDPTVLISPRNRPPSTTSGHLAVDPLVTLFSTSRHSSCPSVAPRKTPDTSTVVTRTDSSPTSPSSGALGRYRDCNPQSLFPGSESRNSDVRTRKYKFSGQNGGV